MMSASNQFTSLYLEAKTSLMKEIRQTFALETSYIIRALLERPSLEGRL